MDSSHIVAENLSFSYIRSQPVLSDVNFTVKRNEIITIIGPNGGGKTTLLRLLLGLLSPDSGSVLINGRAPAENRRCIGYVPQHSGFDRKFPMTVMDVVLSGMVKNFGLYSHRDKISAEKALDDVALLDLKNRHISELSGGQVQRMLISRALVSEKEILFLDEPTSNIDPAAGKKLNSLIKELGKKHTILLVTHDTGFVSNITDRVFCINRTVLEHPVDDQFSEIVASSYGRESKIVRHEKLAEETLENKWSGND